MLGLTGNNVHHDEIRDLLKKATVQANDKDYDTAIARGVDLFVRYKTMPYKHVILLS